MIKTPKFPLTKHRFQEKWYPPVHNKSPSPLKSSDMTVCIGAITTETNPGSAFAIADRMLSTDIDSYEPRPQFNAGSKIFNITPYIVSMFAGDPTLQTEIMNKMTRKIWGNVPDDPDIENAENQTVEGLANAYVSFYKKYREQRIEDQVLSKYGLTLDSFIGKQEKLKDSFIESVRVEINALEVPANEVIFVGLDDKYWPHIYSIERDVAVCRDHQGFAVVGAGGYTAVSVFNQHSFSPGVPGIEALYITYLAKKRAEVTPSVGKITDMWLARGNHRFGIVPSATMAFLERLLERKKQAEAKHWDAQHMELIKHVTEDSGVGLRDMFRRPHNPPPVSS